MKKGLMVLGLFAAALLITPALSNHAAWGYDPYGVGIGGGGGNFIPPNISRVVPRNVPPARRAVPPRHADRPRPAHRTIYARAVNPSYHNPDLVKHYTSARRWRLVPFMYFRDRSAPWKPAQMLGMPRGVPPDELAGWLESVRQMPQRHRIPNSERQWQVHVLDQKILSVLQMSLNCLCAEFGLSSRCKYK